MLHLGGSGRRRGIAAVVIALSLCLVVPESAGIAAAATPTSGGQARPANVVLVARHRSRAAARRRHVLAYLRHHPNYMARKIKAHPALLLRHIRKTGTKITAKKATTTAKRKTKKKKKRGAYVKKVKKKKKKPATKKRKKKATTTAKRRKATKKAKGAGTPIGKKAWLEIALLVLAPFAAVALLLYITDLRRRPRAPSRSKRRRSLVITPLGKG